MPDWLGLLLILAIAAAIWRLVSKPPAVFVVYVAAGEIRATRGTVTDAFRSAIVDVIGDFGLQSGEVRGVARGRRISLWFSKDIPPAARQRLRNWWVQSGWFAAPDPRTRCPRKRA